MKNYIKSLMVIVAATLFIANSSVEAQQNIVWRNASPIYVGKSSSSSNHNFYRSAGTVGNTYGANAQVLRNWYQAPSRSYSTFSHNINSHRRFLFARRR